MQSPKAHNLVTEFSPSDDKVNNNNNNKNTNNNNNTIVEKNLLGSFGSYGDDDTHPTHVLEINRKAASQITRERLSQPGTDHSFTNEKSMSMSEDEEMDEPDAMSANKQNVDQLSKGSDRKQYNGYSDSGDEEMDVDDRLVIDDEDDNTKSLSKSRSIMDKVFTCPQCHVVTTSAKAYLYHLDTAHNVKDSSKRLLVLDEEEQPGSVDSGGSSSNQFLNLSIPLHSTGPSISPKDDDDDDEDESSLNITPSFSVPKTMGQGMPLGITTENIDQMFDDDKKKKKKTRQEVDPGKYFETVDSSGTKYACSQCGNVYKWRKSLNKHWKEKHLDDPLMEVASPPGMLELLKSGKYTQLGSRRIYDNNFLQTIKAQKDDDISRTSTPNSDMKSSTPLNYMDTPSPSLSSSVAALATSIQSSLIPKMIGPFVANTQPVFPGMGMAALQPLVLQNGYNTASNGGALDLTRAAKAMGHPSFLLNCNTPELDTSFDQDQPLDFSKKKGDGETPVKAERMWEEVSASAKSDLDQYGTKIHRCSKCDYTSTSDIDFANHTGSHYTKRVCKCFECKIQFNSMEELNAHYVKDHNKKLTEYKEAIKKIPHGLQQTYHLLKMDLQSIGELNNQDLGATETKSLKCKKCDFEAKWPAELQKHAVSHSEERPYICMVCGSTYKWKWDLVKHFQKSHPALPNPYRRNDKRETPDVSSEDETEDEPDVKRAKFGTASGDVGTSGPYNDDMMSVKGIIAATQAGQRFVSSQLDDESSLEGSLALMQSYPYAAAAAAAAVASGAPINLAQEIVERHTKAQKAIQDAIKNRQNSTNAKSPSHSQSQSSSPIPFSNSNNKMEQLPYKCTMCNYHARWPSEVTQHMKNHSDCKPYLCPRCDYRSKWKWDVVKHLKRCGGGTINDVIDTTKLKNKEPQCNNAIISTGPPNAVVSQQGKVKKTTPQPLSYILPSIDANGQQSALVVRSSCGDLSSPSHPHLVLPAENEMSLETNSNNKSPPPSDRIDLTANNNDEDMSDNNVNNNYASYFDGQPTASINNSSQHNTNAITMPLSSNSPSPSLANLATTTNSTQSSYRQNSSAEVWDCPHCPFTTQSQAELKRHSGLHMDDKPFKCNECHYSTRWACDLKKHRKSYDHYPKHNNNANSNNNTNSLVSKNNDKGHASQQSKTLKEDDTMKKEKGRFKCFQCSLFFINLQNLIDHRKNTHTPSENSATPQMANTNEIDAARIRHPRKQIKQFTCPKCPFICKNRQTMDKHIDEHEQMERDAFQCFYCSSQYADKEGLLDHIISHPAFNPKEWETFFMITDEDDQAVDEEEKMELAEVDASMNDNEQNVSKTSPLSKDQTKVTKMDSEAATQARIQQILDEIPKQKPSQQQTHQASTGFNKFKCEWCPAEFINLTAVYKHASTAHPIQLKEQDVSMSLAYASLHAKNIESQQSNSAGKNDLQSGEALQILKQQIAEKRNHQLAEKINHMVSSNPKLQEVLNKRLEEDMNGSKRFQCDKCQFSTPSQSAFQNHYELHGGTKVSSQCWFCDYSVDRMDLLYQHMKISHTRKWKALSQNPRYANQIQRMNLAFGSSGMTSPPSQATTNNSNSISPSNSADAGAIDLSSKKSASDLGHEIVYVRKPQYTWSGIPVNVIPDGSTLSFVCPKCSFNDASIAKTCAHVMQSHRAMSKFNCTRCQFSDDNIHVMSDHCKTCHPIQERIVEVLDFKQLNFTELQMVQLSAMKDKFPHEFGKDVLTDTALTKLNSSLNDDASPDKKWSCPFCPFQVASKESMKQHVSHHNQNSRYRCQKCDFSSDSTVIMAEHLKVHDDKDSKTTKTSGLSFKQENNQVTKEVSMGEQQMDTEGQKQYEKASTVTATETVKASSPKVKTPGRIRYRCAICPYHTTCKSNIFKHKRQHLIPKRYKCTKCTYTAARAVLLKKHIESHNVPVDDEDGYYHDVFYDPHNTSDEKMEETEYTGEHEAEVEDASEEDSISDDLDNEMNSKAIADLEAKDILEAEVAHKASSSSLLLDDVDSMTGNSGDKQLRKQKCPHCPFSSNSCYEFQKHLNFHGTQERYKCDNCTYSIDRFNLLTQHRKLHANEPGYSINPVPSDLLNTSFILKQNEMTGASEEEKGDASLSQIDIETGSSQFCCTSCSYTASNKSSFDIHCQSHGQRKRFICDFCDWSADGMSLLHQHRKVHETEPTFKSNPNDNIFLNQEFDVGASGEFEAKFMEVQNNGKTSKDGDNNDTHNSPPFKLTVVKKSYPCKLCPYKTNSKINYLSHKNMHSSDGQFTCSECNFSAASRGVLQQHKLLHSSQTPSPTGSSTTQQGNDALDTSSSFCDMDNDASNEFTCQRCPFTAISATSLTEHMKGHGGQNKLVCPYCDFRATSRPIIYSHIQIHFPSTKLEPEAMAKMLEEHTNKLSKESGDLSKNLADKKLTPPENKVVKTKIYVCQYCEREFEAKSLMIQHEKQHLVGSH